MNKKSRKIAAAVCATMMLSLLSVVNALAISENNEFAEFYGSEIFDMDELYYDSISSGYPLHYNSMADGTIDKKSGNYARWIDRFEVPECGMEFYNNLYEWTDNDGIDDFLIEDCYFESGELVTGGGVEYYGAKIASLSFDDKLTSEQSSYYTRMFAAAYAAFDYDNPQNFWLSSKYGVTWCVTRSNNRYIYTFYLKLRSIDGTFDIRAEQYRNENAIKDGIALQNKCIDDIIAGAPLSRYERIKYFNNWLTLHNEYNTYVSGGGDSGNVPLSHECITALQGNIGENGPVCEGYARAMKVLCDKVGIPCILVRGKSTSGVAHMWNNVMLNGKWYAVDVTYNDPVCANIGAVSGLEHENWVLVGSDSLSGRKILNRLTSYVSDLTNQPLMESGKYVHTDPLEIDTFVDGVEFTQISIDINDYIDHELYIDGKKVMLDRYLNGDGYLFYYCIPSANISGEIELKEEKWTQERISDYSVANINEDILLYYYNPNLQVITKQIFKGDYVKKERQVCVRVENVHMPENGWIEINGEKVDCEVNNDGQYQIWAYEVPDDSNELKVTICGSVSDPEDPIPSFVERLYENILNRPSDGNKVDHINNLNNGESACKVAYDFVFSPEFTNLPISNEERVKRMYLTFLNREADPAGLADWTAVLDNGCSIAHIFYGFTQSNEFTKICDQYGITRGTWEPTENRDKSTKLTAFVSRLYTKALGRDFDVDGLNNHTGNYLENHDLYQLAYDFIFSQEFLNKNLTNEKYVDVLYRTFFDREPDPAGKADWLDCMANRGYTREDVLAGFVGSQECIDLVARFGI